MSVWETASTAAPDCEELQSRINKAVYTMELDWGKGTFDLAKIKTILKPEKVVYE